MKKTYLVVNEIRLTHLKVEKEIGFDQILSCLVSSRKKKYSMSAECRVDLRTEPTVIVVLCSNRTFISLKINRATNDRRFE